MRTTFITDQQEIEAIIKGCEHCTVGMIEDDGSPYVIPMNFGYIDGTIILHSGPHGKHLNLLARDSRVCVTFCTDNNRLMYQHPDVACSYSMESKSVLCKGRIEFVEDLEEKERYIKQFMKQYTDREFKISVPAIRNVKVWLLRPETITAKAFGQNFKSKQ
jgi:nitroimidazol reductase NimA-like FMN-containing flavoprotein (pyridoxamine 5'-phosphate oxidase superfamily)